MGVAQGSAAETDLFAGLTGPQADAVRHQDGPLLVLAGAGCGKTRVITRRAAQLARTACAPRQVLAITFTNKAANEMRERIARLGAGTGMTVCTFHSLCARLLRMHHDRAGLPGDFTVFDSADQRKVIKQAVGDAGLNSSNWQPARVQSLISNAKNAMVSAETYEAFSGDFAAKSIARIYRAYEAALAAQHGLDFDDLLLRLAQLLRDDGDLRDLLEDRYRYVLIDEYQDTNLAQYEIARLLTRERGNLCATGDPDQSIYGWRGADIRNILTFEKDYPNAAVVRLERNYRSTKRILAAAGAVILNNVHRKDKTLWTEAEDGPRVRVVTADNNEQESQYIAKSLLERRGAGERPGDVAVFYRTNAMSRALEEAFLKAGIAYQIARGTEFYNRKEIKDILAYARVLANRFDEVSLARIINTPARGIGKTTLDRLVTDAKSKGRPFIESVFAAETIESLSKAAATRVRRFAELLKTLAPLIEGPPVASLQQLIIQTGLYAELEAIAEYDPDPKSNADELVSAAAHFSEDDPEGTLIDWLQYTSLLGDVDKFAGENGIVTLMTLHAAKGLEFDTVFIIGLEEGVLPFERDVPHAESDIEEERRLCFVGMTRAKRHLVMTSARHRMIRGASVRKMSSRFLSELPKADVERVDLTSGGEDGTSGGAGGGGRLPEDIDQWQPGTLLRHDDHGLGRIQWLRRSGRYVRVAVQFTSGREQTFILGFTPLVRVDYDEIGDDVAEY